MPLDQSADRRRGRGGGRTRSSFPVARLMTVPRKPQFPHSIHGKLQIVEAEKRRLGHQHDKIRPAQVAMMGHDVPGGASMMSASRLAQGSRQRRGPLTSRFRGWWQSFHPAAVAVVRALRALCGPWRPPPKRKQAPVMARMGSQRCRIPVAPGLPASSQLL